MTGQALQFPQSPAAQSPASATAHHAELVKQTQKWVAQTFFGTMLRQMRQSPFKNDMFDGGKGGEAFHQMFDQHLAERMSVGAGKKLVDSIVRKIEGAAAYRKMSKLPGAADQQTAGLVDAASVPSMDLNRGRK
jgi:Rod binding domain-containing protein